MKNSLNISTLLYWANTNFPVMCFLNSNEDLIKSEKQNGTKNAFDFILAAGLKKEISHSQGNKFNQLNKFYENSSSLRLEDAGVPSVFGFLSYDLKNEIENLSSENTDKTEMPLLHFFVPEYIFVFRKGKLKIYTENKNFNIKKVLKEEQAYKECHITKCELKQRVSEKQYIKKINAIKRHIQRGDIYEMNFCQEFFADNTVINPVATYLQLNEISPMPFSCFYKLRHRYLICSSPERFLKKDGNKVVSQPIKGTIRRGKTRKEDALLIKNLFESKKEQSENVMIVDLVRNDLSRIARAGTVKVDELFGIYSYKHLHQMISTVSCEPAQKYRFTDIIKNCFPMGSMTGAPKVKAMELIEKYETTKRGLFSGAVGYITTKRKGSGEPDFDFNVVIRSILYNAEKKYVSVMAGSAITAACDAEKEYEECLLKAEPMLNALIQC